MQNTNAAIKRIVVGFDGSLSSCSALECAATLTARYDSDLIGLTIEDERRFVEISFLQALANATGLVTSLPSPLSADRMLEKIEQVEKESKELEEQFYRCLSLYKISGQLIIERTNIVKTLSQYGTSAQLLCLGREGLHRDMPQQKKGASLLALAKIVPTPILATSNRQCFLRKMVLAVDGSDASYRAAKFAVDLLVRVPDAKVFLTTVDSDRSRVEQIQAPIVAMLSSSGVSYETVHQSGAASEVLIETSQSLDADVLAVGAFSSGTIKEAVFGSSTTAAIESAPNAILLVP